MAEVMKALSHQQNERTKQCLSSTLSSLLDEEEEDAITR
jgi:hypothetical protein